MGKDELWALYCHASAPTRGLVENALYEGVNSHYMTRIKSQDSFMVDSLGFPDKETEKRLMRVITNGKPYHLPLNDLYIIGVLGYGLGVIDGKRAERAKKRRQEQWQSRK